MKSTRREFLCAAAVAAAGGVEKKKDVRLRIAVMSDNQLRPERDNWGWYTLDRALEMLRPMDADIKSRLLDLIKSKWLLLLIVIAILVLICVAIVILVNKKRKSIKK